MDAAVTDSITPEVQGPHPAHVRAAASWVLGLVAAAALVLLLLVGAGVFDDGSESVAGGNAEPGARTDLGTSADFSLERGVGDSIVPRLGDDPGHAGSPGPRGLSPFSPR